MPTNTSTHSNSSAPLDRVPSHTDPVVKVGRGGAGNYSTPEDLARTEFENVVKTREVASKAGVETAPNFRGRGGAGNHKDAPDQAEVERVRAQEREEREEREARERARVVQDVEAALAVPQRAHVHDRKNELSR